MYLQKNLINPQTEVFCKGHSSLGDRNYYCWKKKGHGKVNLKKAIKESCDVYFYELAKKTNIDDIAKLSTDLGLNCHLLTAFRASLLKILDGLACLILIVSTLPDSLTRSSNTTEPLMPPMAASLGHLGAIFTKGIS